MKLMPVGYETDEDLRPLWPANLEGVRLRVVAGKHDGGYNYHSRLAVDCCNPEHLACNRSRSSALQVDSLGRNAPLCFLGSWLKASWMPEAEHKAYRPDMATLTTYKELNGL